MTSPRKALVSIDDTPYYHIVSRCVRRAFLCGEDPTSGRCYNHRKKWVEQRIYILSSLFAIDIAAYAVMSNHYHLVIKLAPFQSDEWKTEEVLTRWTALFKGPLLVQKYLKGDALSMVEQKTVDDLTELYRKRLSNLS